MEFHPSESIFICGGRDEYIHLFDYCKNKRIAKIEAHNNLINITSFHHSLSIFLSASCDNTLRIWDYKSQNELVCLIEHEYFVCCAKFHSSKNLIVTCSWDETIKIWNFNKLAEKVVAESQEKVNKNDIHLFKKVKCDQHKFNWVSFHPHLELICSRNYNGVLQIWSYSGSNNDLVLEKDVPKTGYYMCVEAHPKTGQIAASSSFGRFKVLDVDGNCVDTYYTIDMLQSKLDCHKYLPLVALATNNSIVIISLDKIEV